MIKEILCIYVIDDKGTPIFIRENYIQGSQNADHALLSDFISALQSFAKEFGEEETRIVELSDAKIFSTIDRLTNYLFIINSTIHAKPKKMFDLLNKIKNLYIQTFMGHSSSSKEEKSKLMVSFEKALDELLDESTDKLLGFIKSLYD